MPILVRVTIVIVVIGSIFAQTKSDPSPRRGLDPTGSYAFGDFETINRTNGNVLLNIPVASLPPGRAGMSYGVHLIYNSKIWEPGEDSSATGCGEASCSPAQGIKPNADGGWRYGIGYDLELEYRPGLPSAVNCDNSDEQQRRKYRYKLRVVSPDGGKHLMRLKDQDDLDGYYPYKPDGTYGNDTCFGMAYLSGTLVYYSNDGSFLRLEVQHDADSNPLNNPWTLFMKDGTRVEGGNTPSTYVYRPQRIYDRNGNTVELTYGTDLSQPPVKFTKITDDLGRHIDIVYANLGNNLTDTITATGYNNESLVTTVQWQNTSGTISYNCTPYGSGSTSNCAAYKTQTVIDSITLPSQATGLSPYGFTYNARAGEISC